MTDQRSTYNSNINANTNINPQSSGFRNPQPDYVVTTNPGMEGGIIGAATNNTVAYNTSVPSNSNYYNTGNSGSGYYASGIGNAQDRPVTYTSNNNVQDRPVTYTSTTQNQYRASGPQQIPQRTSTGEYVTTSHQERKLCSTPLLILLGLIAIAGIVLGILFGVGVIGGRNTDLHPRSGNFENGETLGYQGEDAVLIDGVGYEPYTVTVDTVIVDTSTGKTFVNPIDRATVERSNAGITERTSVNPIDRATVERSNAGVTERTFVDTTNVNRANIERANIERANIERANLERPNVDNPTGRVSHHLTAYHH